MEKSKKALEALRNDLHHVPMTDRLGSAFRHLDAALSELEGSMAKELTDEEIEQWWRNTHRTMGHMPRTDFEMVAILRSFAESLPPKEQGAEPVKVGCFGDDGLVRVHGKDETCDVCASPTAREKAMEEAIDKLLPLAQRIQAACEDGDVLNHDNEYDQRDAIEYEKVIAEAIAAKSTK